MIDRRTFIEVLAGGSFVVPLASRAQQQLARPFRIGILGLTTAETAAPYYGAFIAALHDLGYIEGRNIVFLYRYAQGIANRLPGLAAELVQWPADVIVASTSSVVAAAKQATETIPIVMVNPTDPVRAGLVASLARPGGNVTGLTIDTGAENSLKLLQILKEIVPGLSTLGVVVQQGEGDHLAAVEATARALGLSTVRGEEIRRPEDIDAAIAAIVRQRAGGFILLGGPITYMRRQQIADLALAHRLPAIHVLRESAQAGLLASYGPSLIDLFRRAALHVDKILKGAKPADLPVEQPTKFEFVINMKTAKALGITISRAILLRADEVIQ